MQMQTTETTPDLSRLSDKKLAARLDAHQREVDAAELALADLRIAAADAAEHAIQDPTEATTLAELTAHRRVAKAERDLIALQASAAPLQNEQAKRERDAIIAAADPTKPRRLIAERLADAGRHVDAALAALAEACAELVAHNHRADRAKRYGATVDVLNKDVEIIAAFRERHLAPIDSGLRAVTGSLVAVASTRGGTEP